MLPSAVGSSPPATPSPEPEIPIVDAMGTTALQDQEASAKMDISTADAMDDTLRKRKSPEAPDPLLQSPQKRPKTFDLFEVDDEAALASITTAIASMDAQAANESTSTMIPSSPLTLGPTSSSDIQLSLASATLDDIMPPPAPPSSQNYPPRENMQFTATDLPKDDDGMMRWLAHRVRDSAAQNRDNIAKSESSEMGMGMSGENSDPESRAERERVRAENRERKKKWREENSDRNKDNDLRGRVSRRANKLFGAENSEQKRAWMEDEFNRRKVKREFKTQLKKNETPGSSCWNANDDFSDNPSQVMADVLTGQEGAAEGLRNWIENGDIDYETWNAACQRLWGDPGMRAYLESLAPETVPAAAAAAGSGGSAQGGKGGAEAGKLADDGLASKFDAAFDAIIGRGVPKPPAAVPEGVPESTISEVVENIPDDEIEAAMEAAVAMELDAVDIAEDPAADSLAQLSEEALLHKLIESGEMSFEDIAALEAALRDENMEDAEGDATIQEIQGQDELQTVEGEVQLSQGDVTATHDVDIGLPDLHSDQTDISELHLHLEMLSPNSRDAFLATFIGQSAEDSAALDEMQLDSVAESVDADTTIVPDIEIPTATMGTEEVTPTEEQPSTEQAEETGAEPSAEVEGDGGVLEFLENAGINLDELSEDQLQKFINAVSGDGDIDAVLAEIHAAQQGHHEVAQVAQQHDDHAQTSMDASHEHTGYQDVTVQDGTQSLTDQIGEDEDGMYEGDYDEDDELDLTPDIMRIILQHSNYESMLGGATIEGLPTAPLPDIGDAHTVRPTPSAPTVPPLPAARAQQHAVAPARTSYTTLQQQQRQQQYAYSPSKYSYSSYSTYGYQRRPEVQVLPPGYSAYQRPPIVEQEAPQYPDLSYLIKPLAYKPKKETVANGTATPTTTTTATTATDDKSKQASVEVNGVNGASADGERNNDNKENKEGKQSKESKITSWAEIFNFKIPIPSFLGRGVVRRTSEQERMEEERNVRAMGFPPMIEGLKL
ncbi:hypothetical protein H072_3897 [Dactylellina haptotyla CBS 200.50]|uniref:DUF3020 domain-containing protein n=1 Tax=Dactylellina haptotyla (strain CBS 200.50) TaxID=1284197 RepID=S8BRN4_DACHA|nr:hypothetical protein H072_3897 [Dactylellina haptotyla CBS 200.50]